MKRSGKILFLGYFFFIFTHLLYSQSTILFSPQDHPTNKLISLIGQAKEKIHAAVYMITDKKIAEALVKAKERGVDVQIVTDKITVEGMYGKGRLLRERGIDVFQFNSEVKKSEAKRYYKASPLMHNKFAIIDNKTWTGSFNWTCSANQKNRENVIILDEKEVCEKYETEFNNLKEKSSKSSNVNENGERSQIKNTERSFLDKVISRFLEVFQKKN